MVRMHTIVGLGNPGEEYQNTRHNAGRIALIGALGRAGFNAERLAAGRLGRFEHGDIAGLPVRILFPDTYMNESGRAIKKLLAPGEEAGLVLVYDDIDLPLGDFKISFGRGDGGHNGLASVIQALGTKDFLRIRVGIAPKTFFGRIRRPEGEKMGAYVLGPLSRREQAKLDETASLITDALETIVNEGRDAAMNRFN